MIPAGIIRGNTVPVIALLAGEALQVVDICSGSHHHFKSRNNFIASAAIPSCTKKPKKQKLDIRLMTTVYNFLHFNNVINFWGLNSIS